MFDSCFSLPFLFYLGVIYTGSLFVHTRIIVYRRITMRVLVMTADEPALRKGYILRKLFTPDMYM